MNKEQKRLYDIEYRKKNKEKRKLYEKEYNRTHPEWYEKQKRRKQSNMKKRRQWLKRIYGITQEQYDEMSLNQSGACAICLKVPENEFLCVDHDHITGKVRGLLCRKCNAALGAMQDNLENISRMSLYVMTHRGV